MQLNSVGCSQCTVLFLLMKINLNLDCIICLCIQAKFIIAIKYQLKRYNECKILNEFHLYSPQVKFSHVKYVQIFLAFMIFMWRSFTFTLND